MNRILVISFLFCVAALLAPRQAAATPVTMAWSQVGNPGNAADSTGFGAVPYSYNIGTNDVTNGQYVAFLNSNDPTGSDPLSLYNGNMSNATFGGINFNSAAGNGSKYSIVSGKGNNPVNYVTWYDAIRFANWMNKGQTVFAAEPTSTNNATESGAYTLKGYAATPSNALSIARNPAAKIFLPSENEWYKAAYYNPATGSYYLYPTSSSSTPNASGRTLTPNSANYKLAVGNLTAVGAYSGTTSPCGAFDMGGNVFQWNEALLSGSIRGSRGGSFGVSADILRSTSRVNVDPPGENLGVGFRVAKRP